MGGSLAKNLKLASGSSVRLGKLNSHTLVLFAILKRAESHFLLEIVFGILNSGEIRWKCDLCCRNSPPPLPPFRFPPT